MKLFKVTLKLHNGIEQKLVFAEDAGKAIHAIPPIFQGDCGEVEELCEAYQIMLATDRRLVFNLGNMQEGVLPFQLSDLERYLRVEMNRLNEEIQAIQEQKAWSLFRILSAQGMVHAAEMIKSLGLPSSIYVKRLELDRLSYLNLIAPVSTRHEEMFDGEMNVLLVWSQKEEDDTPIQKRFTLIKL